MLHTKIFPKGLLPALVHLWGHLTRRRKKQFILLLFFMVVGSIAEVVSLGAVMPFLAVIAAPEKALDTPVLVYLARCLRVSSGPQLLFPLTILFSLTALVAGAIRVLLLWLTTRLTAVSGSELSSEVYRRVLYQPYQTHLSRNSSEVISGIVNKVNAVVFGVMLPVLILLNALFALCAIMFALIFINPLVAFVATLSFGISYWLISLFYRQRLLRNSQRIADEQTRTVKALQEGLGGVRDILLSGTQPLYCDIYKKADLPYRLAAADNAFIGQSPRYTMEAVGMILISSLAYALSVKPGGVATAIPVLGALALGAQRLLPALHQIYSSWTSIVGTHSQLDDTIKMLEQSVQHELNLSELSPVLFRSDIRFENVCFKYAAAGPWVVQDLTFVIPKGARVGFVGSTGSGKSTTLDLLMGLLTPNEGQILVDGKVVSGLYLRAWQRAIAHVPQSIYLADTTFAENIAFGVPRPDMDMSLVRQAARQARISDFIESKTSGYDAFVGERGVCLSGGERQRIGIARALYKQASILVFDEATSALDNATEQTVMDAIEGVDRDITVLLIAHRISTLRCCDTIFKLEHGRVVTQGSFSQVLKSS